LKNSPLKHDIGRRNIIRHIEEKMKTGKLIKELRLKKGLTQEELASMTELSTRTIQRIENGEVDPRSYTLQMIAKALDVEFSIFAENEVEENIKIDNNKWLAILHFSGLLPIFFPSILFWKLRKKQTEDISFHFRAVISLQLMILGISFVGLWIYWKVNQPIPLIGGLLAGSLLTIINSIRVMNNEQFISPFVKNER
jgi:transcriptional regulator with XRE-family HTH domain